MEMVREELGLKTNHIPYRGEAPVITALGSKDVEVGIILLANALPRIQHGELKGIAVFQDTRLPSLPNVPSIAESGVPGAGIQAWMAFFVPVGTPDAAASKLESVFRKHIQSKEFAEWLRVRGSEPATLSNVQFKTLLDDQSKRLAKVIKSVGLTNL